jgi:dynein heavy chain
MDMEQEDMDMDMEGDYGQQPEQLNNMTEDDLKFGEFKHIIENQEDESKDLVMQARQANFITKGTYLDDLISQIETGEQAISFFAKHGHSTPVKFLNCNRKPVPGDQFRPYDLIIVDNEKSLEKEYFTISAQGVVHVSLEKTKQGKKVNKLEAVPTEFLTLSDWMQQQTMFNVLTSMKFFKHYIIGKVFQLWKGNVRFKQYNRTRQNLAKSLIYTRPAFLQTYIDINKILFDMQQNKTFKTPKNAKFFDLEDFVKEQKTERDNAKQHYNERSEEIQDKKLAQLITIITESRTLREEEDLENNKMGQATKNKSMVL